MVQIEEQMVLENLLDGAQTNSDNLESICQSFCCMFLVQHFKHILETQLDTQTGTNGI